MSKLQEDIQVVIEQAGRTDIKVEKANYDEVLGELDKRGQFTQRTVLQLLSVILKHLDSQDKGVEATPSK